MTISPPSSDKEQRRVLGARMREVRKDAGLTAAEIGFYLDAAASGVTSTDRVLRSLEAHFDTAAVVRHVDERYELRGWATHHQAAESPA